MNKTHIPDQKLTRSKKKVLPEKHFFFTRTNATNTNL